MSHLINIMAKPETKTKIMISKKVGIAEQSAQPSASESSQPQSKLKIIISKKPKPLFVLQKHQSCYYIKMHPDKLPDSPKIAAFDLDGTLIKTISGQIYSTTPNDWEWAYPEVPGILANLDKDGYLIMIFSNQYKTDLTIFAAKINLVLTHLQPLNVNLYVATEKDNFRKPMTDMWDLMLTQHKIGGDPHSPPIDAKLGQIPIAPQSVDKLSFYCGDAAGRVKNYLPGRIKDHSISDRYFAYNTNLQFLVPEYVFHADSKRHPYVDKYSESGALEMLTGLNLDDYYPIEPYPMPESLHSYKKVLIIMVGPQAVGKTTLSAHPEFKDYVHLNLDTIKNAKSLLSQFHQNLNLSNKIIIDNTNKTIEDRKQYIVPAKQHGYTVFIYHFDLPKNLCFHMNQMRVQITHGKTKAIPDVAIHTYYKYLVLPAIEEGADEIITLDRLHFVGDEIDPIYDMYYRYKY